LPAPDFHGISETYDWLGKKPVSLLRANQILKLGIELDRKDLSDFAPQSDKSVSRETFWYDWDRNPYKTAYMVRRRRVGSRGKLVLRARQAGRRTDSSASPPSCRGDREASGSNTKAFRATRAEKTIHRSAAEKRI
jgi:hypothetical protein